MSTGTPFSNSYRYPSEIDEKIISFEDIVEKAYYDSNCFDNLNPIMMTRLDTEKLQNCGQEKIMKFLVNADIASMENIPKLIVRFFYLKSQENMFYKLDNCILERLTLSQLLELKAILPKEFERNQELIEQIFQREFHDLITKTFITSEDFLELRSILLRAYKWSLELPTSLKYISSQVLFITLKNALQTQIYDKELFEAYLKNQSSYYMFDSSIQKQQKQQNIYEIQQKANYEETFLLRCLKSIPTKNVTPNELLKSYLQHFFENADSIQPFDQYFNQDYLLKILYQAHLDQGMYKYKFNSWVKI